MLSSTPSAGSHDDDAAFPTHVVGFPVSGEWTAINTPAERIPSHGTNLFGQRFAFDLVRLSSSGASFSRRPLWRQFLYYVDAADFFAWNQPVFSAYPGIVVAAEDDWPDRLRVNALWETLRASLLQGAPDPRDLRSLLGNHVLVQGEPGIALYAHLRQGSVLVDKGQAVHAGQRLGKVGNSGNSTMPHLHFHVMDREDLWQAQGVYCGFPGTDPDARPFVPRPMTPFCARVTGGEA